jgi:hypothetical protein
MRDAERPAATGGAVRGFIMEALKTPSRAERGLVWLLSPAHRHRDPVISAFLAQVETLCSQAKEFAAIGERMKLTKREGAEWADLRAAFDAKWKIVRDNSTAIMDVSHEVERVTRYWLWRAQKVKALDEAVRRWLSAGQAGGPPRNLELLLTVFVPPSDLRAIAGDLEEEYLLYWRPRLGHKEASRRYRSQVFRTILRYCWRNIGRIAAIAEVADLMRKWFWPS